MNIREELNKPITTTPHEIMEACAMAITEMVMDNPVFMLIADDMSKLAARTTKILVDSKKEDK